MSITDMEIRIYNLTVRVNEMTERIEALEQFELDYRVKQQIEYEKGHMG